MFRAQNPSLVVRVGPAAVPGTSSADEHETPVGFFRVKARPPGTRIGVKK